MELRALLQQVVALGASDLHISTERPPIMRRNGNLERLAATPIVRADVDRMLETVLHAEQRDRFDASKELDVAFELPEGRFRLNVFVNRQGPAFVCRVIAANPPSLDSLGAPPILEKLVETDNGLILVTGPTGSGKSSTLAAMVRHINRRFSKHIITIEDPIEFVHEPEQSLVTQREVGRDTLSFSGALRSALREDPDVILVGEMRDRETISLALTAAETGHLVLGTLHTTSAHRAVLRLIDAMPAAERDMARAMLASSLQAVVTQTLLPGKAGGRVGAYEILIGTHAVRHMIQEAQSSQIYSAMQTGSRFGMVTMQDAIGTLVEQERVDASIAREALARLGNGAQAEMCEADAHAQVATDLTTSPTGATSAAAAEPSGRRWF